ncbi:hypothetical protein MJO28_005890 [Puccinia striiformis f. sp. tritici]|uniref:Uncharacterized protein n=4 Tax=Puccinia striiformis TaxID=27350 RepID=A0A0L0URZ2_9BASI|nr:hypothetical protein Pst134EA_011095 [Puccinia striiformis f. sp. tritici]KAI9607707.1 hypothetical protein KEM48_003494 [Puccinia striiformis f. sp. tritici PST-130]KNE89862.1 hypothetical protein PSTG_16686 [Puccinia striiformis f. sp. tritici PST-78]POW06722.1 hypothetical protein PSHT_10243 [Puccinia striiformis]KAH9455853.1 hypothetical protein Pst134EB_012083 [Puccinia striiformis f. sp. tritici]KAH9467451.1 hypothetical protein Pst134EA_011095 [Puccinia striiformis f. sp. tritici]
MSDSQHPDVRLLPNEWRSQLDQLRNKLATLNQIYRSPIEPNERFDLIVERPVASDPEDLTEELELSQEFSFCPLQVKIILAAIPLSRLLITFFNNLLSRGNQPPLTFAGMSSSDFSTLRSETKEISDCMSRVIDIVWNELGSIHELRERIMEIEYNEGRIIRLLDSCIISIGFCMEPVTFQVDNTLPSSILRACFSSIRFQLPVAIGKFQAALNKYEEELMMAYGNT